MENPQFKASDRWRDCRAAEVSHLQISVQSDVAVILQTIVDD